MRDPSGRTPSLSDGIGSVQAMHSLISAIREHDDAAAFLAGPGGLDLDWSGHVDPVHLSSGQALEGFARDGAGGTYFFCGSGGEERPILYADSEGGATLIAVGLPQLLQLLLVAPWWSDCTAFTAEESRTLAAEYLQDIPDLMEWRDRAAALLGLDLPPDQAVLERLLEVALGPGREYTLIFTPENTAYRRLIG